MLRLPEFTLDLSHIRPVATCVDFQQEKVQKLGQTYSRNGLNFTAVSSGKLSIVEFPAPLDAFAWVPPQVRYLLVSQDAKLEIKFPAPVAWTEISVAKIATLSNNAPSLCTITSYAKNAQGWVSSFKHSPLTDSFGLVRSYEFSKFEKVIPPHGEFEKAPEPEALGSIAVLYVLAPAFCLWRVCYA